MFNLSQLNSLSSDLDLRVFSSEYVQTAVFAITDQVSCFVKPASSPRRMGRKPLQQPGRILIEYSECSVWIIIQGTQVRPVGLRREALQRSLEEAGCCGRLDQQSMC